MILLCGQTEDVGDAGRVRLRALWGRTGRLSRQMKLLSLRPSLLRTRDPHNRRGRIPLHSQLALVFKPNKDYSDVAVRMGRRTNFRPALYAPEDLIGGQEPENDRFQTVTKASMNGRMWPIKEASWSKKVEGKAQGPEVISPITNLKLATMEHGRWTRKLQRSTRGGTRSWRRPLRRRIKAWAATPSCASSE